MNPDDTAPATPFTAELTDDAGHVAGRTVEPDMFGGPYAPPIPALIDGSHADGELTFTKFPEGGGQTHTIDYAGTISGDGNGHRRPLDHLWCLGGHVPDAASRRLR